MGIFHYKDQKNDLGIYKNGYLTGFGRVNYSNGDIYDGLIESGNF